MTIPGASGGTSRRAGGRGWRAGLTVASMGYAGTRAACDLAVMADESQFTSFWTGEASSTEAFVTLGAASCVTRNLALGTGVLPIQLRTPPLVAMAVASLVDMVQDREMYVGLGVSSPAVVVRWHARQYSARPVAQMREFVELLRACLSGERVRYEGEFYNVDGFRLGVGVDPARIKIVIAALNPQMLRLAGHVADGVLLNHVPLDQVPWAAEHVRQGGDAEIYQQIHLGVCDPEENLDRARRELFPYMTVNAYARVFERAGFADVVARVGTARGADERRAAIQQIPRELIVQLETMGTPADMVAAIDRYVAAGVTHPIVFPLPYGTDPGGTLRATVAAVAARHRQDHPETAGAERLSGATRNV